jgi:hypothetical protein
MSFILPSGVDIMGPSVGGLGRIGLACEGTIKAKRTTWFMVPPQARPIIPRPPTDGPIISIPEGRMNDV